MRISDGSVAPKAQSYKNVVRENKFTAHYLGTVCADILGHGSIETFSAEVRWTDHCACSLCRERRYRLLRTVVFTTGAPNARRRDGRNYHYVSPHDGWLFLQKCKPVRGWMCCEVGSSQCPPVSRVCVLHLARRCLASASKLRFSSKGAVVRGDGDGPLSSLYIFTPPFHSTSLLRRTSPAWALKRLNEYNS